MSVHPTGMPEPLDASQLLAALNAFKKGDFSVRLPEEWTGVAGKIADAFNETVEINERMAAELERLSRAVGKEGKVNQRASLGDVRGSWASSVQRVNALVTDLVRPTTETARVIGAVAKGDLSQTMALDLDGRPLAGEFLRTARIVNTMVDQLELVRRRGDARGARGRARKASSAARPRSRASPGPGRT